MTLFLIFALVASILLMWVHLFSEKEDNIMEFFSHCFVAIMILCAFTAYSSSPEAIDVYRGKTTLEITYKNSIPIDSVVVFK